MQWPSLLNHYSLKRHKKTTTKRNTALIIEANRKCIISWRFPLVLLCRCQVAISGGASIEMLGWKNPGEKMGKKFPGHQFWHISWWYMTISKWYILSPRWCNIIAYWHFNLTFYFTTTELNERRAVGKLKQFQQLGIIQSQISRLITWASFAHFTECESFSCGRNQIRISILSTPSFPEVSKAVVLQNSSPLAKRP